MDIGPGSPLIALDPDLAKENGDSHGILANGSEPVDWDLGSESYPDSYNLCRISEPPYSNKMNILEKIKIPDAIAG